MTIKVQHKGTDGSDQIQHCANHRILPSKLLTINAFQNTSGLELAVLQSKYVLEYILLLCHVPFDFLVKMKEAHAPICTSGVRSSTKASTDCQV